MRALRALPLALLLAAALASPAASQPASAPLLSPVALGDPAVGRALLPVQAPIRFIDGDRDGALAADEPAYWDLDDSNTVSTGDLRLRPYLAHATGTAVAVTDADAGRDLAGAGGWFGSGSTGWYADLDGSRTVTAGDLRLGDATAVQAGASDLGQPLTYPANAQSGGRASLLDADGDGRRDRGEAAYLDLDAGANPSMPSVSVGDLVVSYRPAPPASSATRGTAADGGDGSGAAEDNDGVRIAPRGDDGLRGFDVVVLALLAVNLLGLAYVARAVRGGRPRNPFK